MTQVDISSEAVERLTAAHEGRTPLTWQVAAKAVDELTATLRAQAERIAELEAERNAFRAVLEGAGYGDIDGIAKQDPDLNRMLGLEVARLTQLEGSKARNDALREGRDKISGECFAMPGNGPARSYNRGVQDALAVLDALIEGDTND